MKIIYQTVQEGVLGPVFLKISSFLIVLQSSRPRGDVILNSPQMTLSFESTNLVLIKEMLVFKRTTNSSDPRNSVMTMVLCCGFAATGWCCGALFCENDVIPR